MRNPYKILVGKTEGNRQLKKPWNRWEDNIKMDLNKILWNVVDWIHLAGDTDL
jgi:hypothetical protein